MYLYLYKSGKTFKEKQVSRLEKRKKAREKAKVLRDKDLKEASDKILKLGKQVEETKEGSDEEKALLKRRNLYINYFNKRKKQ
jgi:hypothetical protein